MVKICSIDPAFKKCGAVVIDSDFKIHFSDNMNFLDNYQKTNQTEYTIALWKAIKSQINALNMHKPDIWLIENQIGKFACVQVHSMLIQAIHDLGGKVISQSPRFKLADSLGLENYQASDSNKYNQNKNRSVAICSNFLQKSYQQHISLDRDVSDAILQAIYYIQHTIGTSLDYTKFQQPVAVESQHANQQLKPKVTRQRKVKTAMVEKPLPNTPAEPETHEQIVAEVVVSKDIVPEQVCEQLLIETKSETNQPQNGDQIVVQTQQLQPKAKRVTRRKPKVETEMPAVSQLIDPLA